MQLMYASGSTVHTYVVHSAAPSTAAFLFSVGFLESSISGRVSEIHDALDSLTRAGPACVCKRMLWQKMRDTMKTNVFVCKSVIEVGVCGVGPCATPPAHGRRISMGDSYLRPATERPRPPRRCRLPRSRAHRAPGTARTRPGRRRGCRGSCRDTLAQTPNGADRYEHSPKKLTQLILNHLRWHHLSPQGRHVCRNACRIRGSPSAHARAPAHDTAGSSVSYLVKDAIRRHQTPSDVIRRNQTQSDAIG